MKCILLVPYSEVREETYALEVYRPECDSEEFVRGGVKREARHVLEYIIEPLVGLILEGNRVVGSLGCPPGLLGECPVRLSCKDCWLVWLKSLKEEFDYDTKSWSTATSPVHTKTP